MMLVFLDLETTGLDERNGLILEVAAVMLRNDGDKWSQRVLIDTVVKQNKETALSLMNETVWKMHTDNGLIEALPEGAPLGFVQDALSEELLYLGADRITLAGNSVHFDRRWLKRHMPAVEVMFHHRHMDVSSLKMNWDIANPWCMVPEDGEPDPANDHRALNDCFASIASFLWINEGTKRK